MLYVIQTFTDIKVKYNHVSNEQDLILSRIKEGIKTESNLDDIGV